MAVELSTIKIFKTSARAHPSPKKQCEGPNPPKERTLSSKENRTDVPLCVWCRANPNSRVVMFCAPWHCSPTQRVSRAARPARSPA